MVSMEMGAAFPNDLGAAELAILDAWRDHSLTCLPADLQPPAWPDASPGSRIGAALRSWAEAAPRPLVVFLDEIDALRDEFWRQHGEPLLRTAPYSEVAPHLVLMAFLHCVVNGGTPAGTSDREYAIGRGQMDLCLRYAGETLAIEIKVWRPGRPDPLVEGLGQLDGYLAGLGLDSGWLVIFDRRPDLPPVEERVAAIQATTPAGRQVTVIRA